MEGIFTHDAAIKRSRTFPEVFKIDTAYKTSATKIPLVNIAGIDNMLSEHSTNTLRTFFVVYAVVTNERETSYDWVLTATQLSTSR